MSGAGNGEGYRPDVDGMRAIAVTVVVAFHAGVPYLGGGYVGVDVFFVLSGFLITGLLANELEARDGIGLGAFYARRVRRLLPALAFMLLGTLLVGQWLLLPWGERQRLAQSALATAAFSSNFYFWIAAGDYFAAPVEREPLLHTWSLAVEEQFYFLWPVTLLAAHRAARALGRPTRTTLLAVLGIAGAVSFAACVLVTASSQATAFYLVPYRAWEFAFGGILALSRWKPGERVASVLGVLGLTAILGSSVVFGHHTSFPGWAALVPTLGTVGLLAAGGGAVSTRWLSSAPLVWIGKLSYSWYLWHWPLIAFARASTLTGPDPVRDTTVSLVGLAIAACSYRFVEMPIRVAQPGPFRLQRGTLLAGLSISLGLGVLAAAEGFAARWALRNMEPYVGLQRALAGEPSVRSCHADSGCRSGDLDSTALLIWGDSHALSQSGLLVDTPVVERFRMGCAPLLGKYPWQTPGVSGEANCADFNESVARQVEVLASRRQLAGVVLAARWTSYTGREDRGRPLKTLPHGADPLQTLSRGLEATLDRLARAGVRVAILGPLPEQETDVPLCLLRREPGRCVTGRDFTEPHRSTALGLIRSVARRHGSVRVVDLFDVLCPGGSCPASEGGRPLFRDPHHVTRAATERMRPAFATTLAWLRTGIE